VSATLRWLASWLAALLLFGCGARAAVVRPEAQGLRVRCDNAAASVFVDDRFAGRAAELRGRDLPILPGFHRVEVRAEGFFPRYAEVEIQPGGRAVLDVTLRPRLEIP
jgi:hypothetical protein